MWLIALLILTPVFAQIDLTAIQELDEELPTFGSYKQAEEDYELQRLRRNFQSPTRSIGLGEIKRSGTDLGAIREGRLIRNLKTNKNFKLTKLMYVRYFKQEDEFGFKYLVNSRGGVEWRIHSDFVEPMKQDLAMYEPPLKYTPAPTNIVRTVYDGQLSLPLEFGFYSGFVRGDFMRDLFEDKKARTGLSNQYAVHLFAQWDLPIKPGLVLHYERASYQLDNGGQVLYTSPSLGPQFKTREFEVFGHPVRFQTQFRVSSLAKVRAETKYGEGDFKFNSADFLNSLERPVKNRFGEFVLGLFYQTQWLNLKDQTVPVQLKASNQTNKAFGLSLSQVFQ